MIKQKKATGATRRTPPQELEAGRLIEPKNACHAFASTAFSLRRGMKAGIALKQRCGFTLVELMVSMGILVVIMLMMARVFTDASAAWRAGTRRAYEAQSGRVIMDFIKQELSQAIADDLVSFRIHSEPGPLSLSVWAYPHPDYPESSTDSICFVAATRPPPYGAMRRAVPHYIYYVDYMLDIDGQRMDEGHPEGPRYALMRTRKTGTTHNTQANLENSAYRNPQWWQPDHWVGQTREIIAENVSGFEVWAAKGSLIEAGVRDPDTYYIWNYDSVEEGEPPLWVDIYLMLMDEPAAIQAAALWRANDPDRREFVNRNTRRYSARIYFRNREGYTR